MKQLLLTFFSLIGLFLFVSQVSAQTVPQGSITVPSSCSSFPCNVSVSWAVTHNPDGDPTSSMVLALNGSQIGSGQSGSISSVNLTAPSSFSLTVGSTIVDTKAVALAPTATPAPTSTPSTCDQSCGGSQGCVSGLSCINGKCRLPSYPDRSDCSTPSYPDYRSCNQSCGSGNQQCVSGLSCINNLCRHPQYPDRTDCSSPTSSTSNPTSTPTPKPAGTTNVQVISNSTQNTVSDPEITPEVLGEQTVNAEGTSDSTNTSSNFQNNETAPQSKGSFVKKLAVGALGALTLVYIGLVLQSLGIINLGVFKGLLNGLGRLFNR